MAEIYRHTQNETITITLFTGHLEGLCALSAWIDGFEAGGKGTVPGHMDLIMHLREVQSKRGVPVKLVDVELPPDMK